MMFQDLLAMDKKQLQEHIAAQLQTIEEKKEYNAFITVTESSKAQPTIAIKDNILVSGMRCTGSSKILDNYTAPYNATAVQRLHSLSIIGKTSLDAFGTGSTGSNSDYGAVKNPFDKERVAGGSSAGNGVALALDMCDLALGSDTYGSLRSPAAFCGVYGLRPSYGLVSRYGLMDLAMSFDTIGPMARDVYGIAYLLSMIAGKDDKDLLTEPSNKNYVELLENKQRSMVVLNTEGLVDKKVDKEMEKALKKLEAQGLERIDVELPDLEKSIPMYYITMAAEFSSAMQKFDSLRFGVQEESVEQSRGKWFNDEVKRRIILGTHVTMKEHLHKWYSNALKTRATLKKQVNALLEQGDVLITPTMPVLPWKIEEVMDDPLKNYAMDLFAGLAPITGGPALSVPIAESIGLQIQAPRFAEERVLQVGGLL